MLSKKNNKISIVIPVYQNNDSIMNLFEKINQLEINLKKINITTEIICVDDGSTDNSFQ